MFVMEFETNIAPTDLDVARADIPRKVLQPVHSLIEVDDMPQQNPGYDGSFEGLTFEKESSAAAALSNRELSSNDHSPHKFALVGSLCATVLFCGFAAVFYMYTR